jgi:hypothetical protein
MSEIVNESSLIHLSTRSLVFCSALKRAHSLFSLTAFDAPAAGAPLTRRPQPHPATSAELGGLVER